MNYTLKTLSFSLLLLNFSSKARSLENVLLCGQDNGYLAHSIFKDTSGNFIGHLAFPPYTNTEIDPTGETLSIAVPLENGNLFNINQHLEHINQKTKHLKTFFPDFKNDGEATTAASKVKIDFGSDCQHDQQENFKFISCFKDEMKLNGHNIYRVSLTLQTQVRTNLIDSETEINKYVLTKSPVVYADFEFSIYLAPLHRHVIRSSYTYYPNGEDIQCFLGKNKLSELVN